MRKSIYPFHHSQGKKWIANR